MKKKDPNSNVRNVSRKRESLIFVTDVTFCPIGFRETEEPNGSRFGRRRAVMASGAAPGEKQSHQCVHSIEVSFCLGSSALQLINAVSVDVSSSEGSKDLLCRPPSPA